MRHFNDIPRRRHQFSPSIFKLNLRSNVAVGALALLVAALLGYFAF